MKLIKKFRVGVVLMVFAICVSGWALPHDSRKFDEFGDIKCEDEMARLDNIAVHLQSAPENNAVIIF
jgi:hypothetical protein